MVNIYCANLCRRRLISRAARDLCFEKKCYAKCELKDYVERCDWYEKENNNSSNLCKE